MSDADPFLEAIWANPDDDLPRLVYADWLEERGESTYAEFIRLDCMLERKEPMMPRERGRLRQHRHDLRTKLAAEWGHVLGEHDRWVLFSSRRGLFEPEPTVELELFP